MTQVDPWMSPEGAQVELFRERCVPKVVQLSSEVSECEPLLDGFEQFIMHMQSSICADVEALDGGSAKFSVDAWKREGNGTGFGVTRVLEGGDLFEKAAANVSVIRGGALTIYARVPVPFSAQINPSQQCTAVFWSPKQCVNQCPDPDARRADSGARQSDERARAGRRPRWRPAVRRCGAQPGRAWNPKP